MLKAIKSFSIYSLAIIFSTGLFFLNSFAAESEDFLKTLKKIDTYSKGLKVGMTLEEAQTTLGKPREKKEVNTARAASAPSYVAMWDEKGYSIDARFDKANHIVSYGIHWFGNPSDIPEFNDILAGKFEVTERLGTRTARLEGKELSIHWIKNPVPNSTKNVSILSVMKKR